MRSFLLFLCCFTSIAGAIYLGLQGVFQPNETLVQATPLTFPIVDVPVVTRKVKVGDILYSNEILWLPVQKEIKGEETLSRIEFQKRSPAYFAVRTALEDGELISASAIIWPDDPRFVQLVLQPGTQAIELNEQDFAPHISFDIQVGSKVDLFLERLKKHETDKTRTQKLPLMIAQSLRVIQMKLTEKSTLSVILEGNASQIEAIMKARVLGNFSVILKNRYAPPENRSFSEMAISKLNEILARKKPITISTAANAVLIQRGTNREYFTFGGAIKTVGLDVKSASKGRTVR